MIVIQILKQNSVKIEIPEMLILNLILYGGRYKPRGQNFGQL